MMTVTSNFKLISCFMQHSICCLGAWLISGIGLYLLRPIYRVSFISHYEYSEVLCKLILIKY